MLSGCAGPLPIDQEVYSQLLASGQFEQMDLDVDEVRVVKEGGLAQGAQFVMPRPFGSLSFC